MAPAPIAIFKGNKNMELSKKFVDYLLGKEAQTKIAEAGTVSVRPDVISPAKFGLPTPEEAMKRAIKIDYLKMMADKEATVKKFTEILQGKK